MQKVGKVTDEVRNIVFAKESSIQDKSSQLGAYVVVCFFSVITVDNI